MKLEYLGIHTNTELDGNGALFNEAEECVATVYGVRGASPRTIGRRISTAVNAHDEIVKTLTVLAEILKAPTNRFGKLEFYTEEAREARESLRQMAVQLDVTRADSVPHQASLVARAILAKLEADK